MKNRKVLWLVFVLVVAIACNGCGKKKGKIKPSDLISISTNTDAQVGTTEMTTEALPEVDADGFYVQDSYVEITAEIGNILINPSLDAPIYRMMQKGEVLESTGYNDTLVRVTIEATNFYIDKNAVEFVTSNFGDVDNPEGKLKIVMIDPCNQKSTNSEPEAIGPNSDITKDGVSSGSTGVLYGTKESELNLEYATLLKEELRKRGYQVYMTRETDDVNITNKERAELANASGASVMVRIQMSESSDASLNGIMSICISEENPYHSELYRSSNALAVRLLQGITANTTYATNHGVLENDQMTALNYCEIPSATISLGYLTNETDEANLVSEWYKEVLIKGLADGLDAYFK